MTIGIAPITGIPFPFVSVGGSSMISNLLGMGDPAGRLRSWRATVAPELAGLELRALVALARDAHRERPAPRPARARRRADRVAELARALRAGGEAGLVVQSAPGGSPAPSGSGSPRAALRAAGRGGARIVGVGDGSSLPYVLDTDLVAVEQGRALPLEAITRALARALGPAGVGLAARLPALRPAVLNELVSPSPGGTR